MRALKPDGYSVQRLVNTRPISHQLPCIRPDAQEPVTCFAMAWVSMSSKVLPSFRSEDQAPENGLPDLTLAVHVPSHPRADFLADHVPCRRI